jgi:uncharacterized protein YbaR (Trm112 family)
MFIELVDALRCPNPHEESWLVATAERMIARHIVDGVLGCPVCMSEFPVRRGVVDFRRTRSGPTPPSAPPASEQAMRIAALLALSDASGFAVLAGEWAVHTPLLVTMVETPLVLVDPPAEMEGEPGVSIIRCDGPLPLATGAARGVAIDAGSSARIASAVTATRVKGRLMAPVSVPLPDGVRELARDDTTWVGERETVDSPLIRLHVRRG